MEDSTMIYKAIPGPQIVGIKNGKYHEATDLFANMINEQAAAGWKFVSMETISTVATKGCLFWKQIITTDIYMLIFCKEQ